MAGRGGVSPRWSGCSLRAKPPAVPLPRLARVTKGKIDGRHRRIKKESSTRVGTLRLPRCARCRPRGRCRSPTSRVRGVFRWGRKVSRSAGGERRREICPSKGRPQFLHHRQLAAWKRRGSKRGEIEAVLAHALGHAVYVFSALGRRRAFDPEDSSQSISTFPRSCFRRLRNKRSRVSPRHTPPRASPLHAFV